MENYDDMKEELMQVLETYKSVLVHNDLNGNHRVSFNSKKVDQLRLFTVLIPIQSSFNLWSLPKSLQHSLKNNN